MAMVVTEAFELGIAKTRKGGVKIPQLIASRTQPDLSDYKVDMSIADELAHSSSRSAGKAKSN